jgi:hypothetical protein
LFGTPTAFSETTEEQGRKTLHGHFLIWIAHLNDIRDFLHFPDKRTQTQAAATIVEQLEKVASCKCFFNYRSINNCRTDHRLFPHQCEQIQIRYRQNPKVISDQQLRELRCKRKCDDAFVYCPHCNKKWNDLELLNSYLTDKIKIPNFNGMPDLDVRRLKSYAIKYQKQTNHDAMINRCIVDSAYNHHIHTASCFKRQKSEKTSDSCKEIDECRYRYPQR